MLQLRYLTHFIPDEIYDIRAEKERNRRANGPFMKPLFHQPTELTTVTPPPSHIIASPAQTSRTSHSSTSLHPEPTLPSIYSSQHGSGFVPSHHTSPVIAHRGTSSTSSSATWNTFTPQPEINFIPDQTHEVEFFAKTMDKDLLDMKSVWNLVEERKREDQLLRAEFGWASQSGIDESQMSQLQSQSQQVPYEQNMPSIYEQQESCNRLGPVVDFPGRQSSLREEEEFLQHTQESGELELSDPASAHSEEKDDTPNQLQMTDCAAKPGDTQTSTSPMEIGQSLVDIPEIIEDEEDEGIPWF